MWNFSFSNVRGARRNSRKQTHTTHDHPGWAPTYLPGRAGSATHCPRSDRTTHSAIYGSISDDIITCYRYKWAYLEMGGINGYFEGCLDCIQCSASFTFNVACPGWDQTQLVLDARIRGQWVAVQHARPPVPASPPTEVCVHVVLSACAPMSSPVFQSLACSRSLEGPGWLRLVRAAEGWPCLHLSGAGLSLSRSLVAG